MPVYLDDIATDDTNHHLVNFAVFADIPTAPPEHTITFKLRPINIAFKDFETLFFKKRKALYTVAKLDFLNDLFNKVKPKISCILQDILRVSNKASILLNKELFDIVLETRIRNRVSLTHVNFVKAINSINDTYVRITLSLGIVAISAALNIEFIFKMKSIPHREIFDADDLLKNVYDIFHGATDCVFHTADCDEESGPAPVDCTPPDQPVCCDVVQEEEEDIGNDCEE
jgi:hypothetical protein